MFYQFSQENCYLLQEALSCLRSAKYEMLGRMPSMHDQITRDLRDIEEMSRKLYDSGVLNPPFKSGENIKW